MTQEEANKLVKGQHIKVLYRGPNRYDDTKKISRFTDALVQEVLAGRIMVYLYPAENEDALCHQFGTQALIPLDDCYLPTLTNNKKLDAIRKILN